MDKEGKIRGGKGKETCEEKHREIWVACGSQQTKPMKK